MLKVACIPAYNVETMIYDVVTRSKQFVDMVIVCDDGSTDDTLNQASRAGAITISHEKNLGKGAALKSLFNYCIKIKADIVITIDGDGQFLPEEITKLTKSMIENNSDVVIGYRFEDNEEMPGYRKVGNKFLDHMSNSISESPFRDTQSGFRSYSNKAINTINFNHVGFTVDAEILIDASQKGLKISEEKVTVLYDTGQKTSTKHPILHAGEVFASLIEMIIIKHPLKYLGIPGVLILFLGITFSIITVIIFNDLRTLPISYAIVSLVFLTLGSMLVLISGVLFSINRTVYHK
jgi:glycosyltransferase involved in cell wall biosynthesis